MKNLTILALGLAIVLACGTAGATNITVQDDGQVDSGAWFDIGEDNEVEPGMVSNDSWDLEGMMLEKTSSATWLYLVGTYDFSTGQAYANGSWNNYTRGDLFVDVTAGNPGTLAWNVATGGNRFGANGYDYVLDVNWNNFSSLSAQAYSTVSATFQTVNVPANQPESDPLRLLAGGVSTGSVTMSSGVSAYSGFTLNGTTPFNGRPIIRRQVGFDLTNMSTLFGFSSSTGTALRAAGYYTLTYHFTMLCGNDNLMGQHRIYWDGKDKILENPVPEPASMTLLGLGLAGFAVRWARRRNSR